MLTKVGSALTNAITMARFREDFTSMTNKNSLIIRPAGYGFKVTSVFRILGAFVGVSAGYQIDCAEIRAGQLGTDCGT